MQADSLETGGLLPASMCTAARNAGAVVIITDYWIARRQRVHLLWDPETDRQWEERQLAELLITATEERFRLALIVGGTRTRPRPYWWITLMQHPKQRETQ